ncbi:MAG: gamma subclass chorismate mutase AroQ [Pseudomonadota bacterium]
MFAPASVFSDAFNSRGLLLLVTWCCLAGGAHASSNTVGADTLSLVQARLLLMKDVARYKWHHDQPVEDLAREQVVLEHARSDALRHGLNVESYQAFMSAQINAAKAIQHYWFRRWQRGAPPDEGPDLAGTIRPQLITLGQKIAHSLTTSDLEHKGAGISVRGLDKASAEQLTRKLALVRRYAHRLEQVLSSGTLRIGTTGDYAPFSLAVGDTQAMTFEGIDIDLAIDLARSLGVEPVFVRTSWPTLMADLTTGAFDVGRSGISRTITRSREAFFTQPYHRGGKTPIARCVDRDRFSSLADIDKPGVRVIVNPGGTNEAFTRQLTAANITVFEDNTAIFTEIIENRADIMFTDLIEVQLQTSIHPELCGTQKVPLTYQEKAILLPQDLHLMETVRTWLDQRLGDGTVRRLFDRHTADGDAGE